MVTVVIVDDEKRSRSFLKGHINTFCPGLKIVGEAESVSSAVKMIRNLNPALVFLDIKMPDGTGFDVIEQLRKEDENESLQFKIIFTTAFDQYAIKAIKFSALDYLLKPIDPDELVAALKKIKPEFPQKSINENIDVLINNVKLLSDSNKKIALNTSNKTYIYKIDEIVRCESSGSYTIFYIKNSEPILISKSLGETEDLLKGHQFERIHKSHLINLNYLRTFIKSDGGFVEMENGDKIPVSNRKREHLTQLLKAL
jgi:two-component system LytT family response regulator